MIPSLLVFTDSEMDIEAKQQDGFPDVTEVTDVADEWADRRFSVCDPSNPTSYWSGNLGVNDTMAT
jgi:hypothetical protein